MRILFDAKEQDNCQDCIATKFALEGTIVFSEQKLKRESTLRIQLW